MDCTAYRVRKALMLMQSAKMHHLRRWRASKVPPWDWQMSCSTCGRSCWSWAAAQVHTCCQSYHRCGKMEAHNFLRTRAKLRVLLSVGVAHWAQLTSSTFKTRSYLFSVVFLISFCKLWQSGLLTFVMKWGILLMRIYLDVYQLIMLCVTCIKNSSRLV